MLPVPKSPSTLVMSACFHKNVVFTTRYFWRCERQKKRLKRQETWLKSWEISSRIEDELHLCVLGCNFRIFSRWWRIKPLVIKVGKIIRLNKPLFHEVVAHDFLPFEEASSSPRMSWKVSRWPFLYSLLLCLPLELASFSQDNNILVCDFSSLSLFWHQLDEWSKLDKGPEKSVQKSIITLILFVKSFIAFTK